MGAAVFGITYLAVIIFCVSLAVFRENTLAIRSITVVQIPGRRRRGGEDSAAGTDSGNSCGVKPRLFPKLGSYTLSREKSCQSAKRKRQKRKKKLVHQLAQTHDSILT